MYSPFVLFAHASRTGRKEKMDRVEYQNLHLCYNWKLVLLRSFSHGKHAACVVGIVQCEIVGKKKRLISPCCG